MGVDDLVANDLGAGIVAALHQYIRLDLRDQIDRRILFEDGDGIDRFRRNPGNFAIDEFVEHEIADAKYRLAANRMRQGIKIEHRNSSSVASGAPSAKTIGAIEEALDVGLDRVFQRGEPAVVAGPL